MLELSLVIDSFERISPRYCNPRFLGSIHSLYRVSQDSTNRSVELQTGSLGQIQRSKFQLPLFLLVQPVV